MLTTLRIKNIALVADLTLELQPGCNVVTGETGAGKSIIIGALNLVLGERADRTLIRSGSDSCSVEAVFDVTKLRAPFKSFLDENGLEPCEDHQLVLKRTFTNAGTNRQFVNGSATTLNVLAAIGEWLSISRPTRSPVPAASDEAVDHPRCVRRIGAAARSVWKIGSPPGGARG
jgi:DNA repair protein RecN (Recombination protein N)